MDENKSVRTKEPERTLRTSMPRLFGEQSNTNSGSPDRTIDPKRVEYMGPPPLDKRQRTNTHNVQDSNVSIISNKLDEAAPAPAPPPPQPVVEGEGNIPSGGKRLTKRRKSRKRRKLTKRRKSRKTKRRRGTKRR